MTMCAAITVPIIKDGYRLYPGMPVSSDRSGSTQTTNMVVNQRVSRQNSQTLYFQQQQSCGSPSEASTASSPPGRNNCVHGNASNSGGGSHRNGIIVGGAVHQVVLLQPRTRPATNQPQISARSSFEVGPTQMNYWTDQAANRTAMSTSQLYIQKKRELCIQQQLQKQEMAKKQLQQQQLQQQQQRSDSINSNTSGATEERKRKTSQGDHNNNSDSEPTNPFRKLLRRLGFGSPPTTNGTPPHRHVTFDTIGSDCESGIEQGVSATETSMAVAAWH